MRVRLAALVNETRFAFAYLDHLDSYTYASLVGPRVVVDLHNVYSLIAHRAAEEGRAIWRPFLRDQARLLERAEAAAARHATALLTVSETERAHFESLGARNAVLVPNGVDCSLYRGIANRRESRAPLILYVGAMSWKPNADAAAFLASDVLPVVRKVVPDVRLRIVGRDPLSSVSALSAIPGVEVTGTVGDVRPHLAEARVLAVPLETGGGTRLKILEAFAAGLPVVSTPVGAEGLNVVADRHLVIAERQAFPQAIARALTDGDTSLRMAVTARELAERDYDWEGIGVRAVAEITRIFAIGAS